MSPPRSSTPRKSPPESLRVADVAEMPQALKGRNSFCFAPSGRLSPLMLEPRALPWAILFGPFRAVLTCARRSSVASCSTNVQTPAPERRVSLGFVRLKAHRIHAGLSRIQLGALACGRRQPSSLSRLNTNEGERRGRAEPPPSS